MAKIDLAVLGLSRGPHVIVAKAGAAMYVDSQPSNLIAYSEDMSQYGLIAGLSDDYQYIYVNRGTNLGTPADHYSLVADDGTVLAEFRLGNYITDPGIGVWHNTESTCAWWAVRTAGGQLDHTLSLSVNFTYGSQPDQLIHTGTSVSGNYSTSGLNYIYYNTVGQTIYSITTDSSPRWRSPETLTRRDAVVYAQFPSFETISLEDRTRWWGDPTIGTGGLLYQCGVIMPPSNIAQLATQQFVYGNNASVPGALWSGWTSDFRKLGSGAQIVAKVVDQNGIASNKFVFRSPVQIMTNITNGSVWSGLYCPINGRVVVSVRPAEGYDFPRAVQVLNASYEYDHTTGEIVIFNPGPRYTNPIVVGASCPAKQYSIILSSSMVGGHLDVVGGKTTYTYGEQIGVVATPDNGYTFPYDMRVTNFDPSAYCVEEIKCTSSAAYTGTMGKTYHSNTGIGELSRPIGDLIFSATFCQKTNLNMLTPHVTANTEYVSNVHSTRYPNGEPQSVSLTCDQGYLFVGPLQVSSPSELSGAINLGRNGSRNASFSIVPREADVCSITCPVAQTVGVSFSLSGATLVSGPSITAPGRLDWDGWRIALNDPTSEVLPQSALTITNAQVNTYTRDGMDYALTLTNVTGAVTISGSTQPAPRFTLKFSNNLAFDIYGGDASIQTSDGTVITIPYGASAAQYAGTVITTNSTWFVVDGGHSDVSAALYRVNGGEEQEVSFGDTAPITGDTEITYIWSD